jgi:hypothetical protein
MNDRFELLRFPTRPGHAHRLRRMAAASLDVARRGVALGLIWLLVPLAIGPLTAFGQEVPPPPPPDQQQTAPPADQQGAPPSDDQGPPPQSYNALSPEQVDQLVAPIALYPDSLVAQVVAGATYPTQVVDADRFVKQNQGVPPDQLAQMVNGQPWDPSIKALTAFPTVLANMDQNLDWTTQLGNAYYNQPQDVMDAVQAMRQEAYQRGDLRNTPQEDVNYAPGNIVIEPANPAVVYVPYYNPWTVWGFHPWYAYYMAPPPPGIAFVGGLGIGFGFGVVVGAWSHWGWGWGAWHPYWGPHAYVGYHGGFWMSRSYTVVNHGHFGYFDRRPEARAFNHQMAVRARANGYAHGYAAGQRNGNRGAYNRGYNRGVQNDHRAPVQNRQNYNRPGQNFNRPANRPQSFNRGAQNNSRPQANRGRPAAQNRQSRPAQNNSHPRGNSKPHGSGGDHSHGGGDHHNRR